MFHILGFFLAIVIIIGILLVSFAGWVLRTIFGVGSNRSSQQNTQRRSHSQQQSYHRSSAADKEEAPRTEGTSQTPRKKIFTEDEGEYVDFEEIK